MAQAKILKLREMMSPSMAAISESNIPQPFPNGQALQTQILRELENEIAEIKNGTEPMIFTKRIPEY